MRVAVYSRVSSSSQSDEAQLQELLALCARSRWEVVSVYRETVSGTLSAAKRPALARLLVDAKRRKFEKVVVWSADRLGRSMRHLVTVLSEFHDSGIALYSYKQGVDTSSPMGAMLWQFLGIFAEFENGIRRERQAAGIASAKAKGVRFGRRPVKPDVKRKICALRRSGRSINKIARELKVGVGTIMRTLESEKMRNAKELCSK